MSFKFRGGKLLSALGSSYVTVSKIRVIDINLAVKRPGLGEEEEVESIQSLVKKTVPSEALFSRTVCVSAPSAIRCVHAPRCFRSCLSEFFLPISTAVVGGW